jgi:hypothetical protein
MGYFFKWLKGGIILNIFLKKMASPIFKIVKGWIQILKSRISTKSQGQEKVLKSNCQSNSQSLFQCFEYECELCGMLNTCIFWSTLIYIHVRVSCCPNSPLTTISFWRTINLCLEFWIGCNFINFIYKCCHMFHQTSISMPPTIQCIIKRTFRAIYLKCHFQSYCFFVL